MTPIELLDSLQVFIENAVKEYCLETKKENALKEPNVHEGYLPIKDSKNADESEFPYVILRILDGEDTEVESKVNIRILIGTYSKSVEGWKDGLNILNRIRIKLFEKRILDKKYRIEYPFKFNIPEEQPYPEWIVEARTVWVLPKVEEIYNEGE